MKLTQYLGLGVIVFFLAACQPEVGSEKWCQQIKDKSAGDITANEAADYAKHCVFKWSLKIRKSNSLSGSG